MYFSHTKFIWCHLLRISIYAYIYSHISIYSLTFKHNPCRAHHTYALDFNSILLWIVGWIYYSLGLYLCIPPRVITLCLNFELFKVLNGLFLFKTYVVYMR